MYGYGVWSAQTRRLLENCFFHRRGVNPEQLRQTVRNLKKKWFTG